MIVDVTGEMVGEITGAMLSESTCPPAEYLMCPEFRATQQTGAECTNGDAVRSTYILLGWRWWVCGGGVVVAKGRAGVEEDGTT
eukprot:gene10627-biopygen4672